MTPGYGVGRDPGTGQLREYGDYNATQRALQAIIRRNAEREHRIRERFLYRFVRATIRTYPPQVVHFFWARLHRVLA